MTGLVSTSTTDTDFAWAIDPAVSVPLVPPEPRNDVLLGDPLHRAEARVDRPRREAAADQADHRAEHDHRDEPLAPPRGRGHSVGAAARCLR